MDSQNKDTQNIEAIQILDIGHKGIKRQANSTLYRLKCIVCQFSPSEKNELTNKKKQHILYALVPKSTGFSNDLIRTEQHLNLVHFKEMYCHRLHFWETVI